MGLSGIVLVTGGAGFIGSHIAARFAESGARVRVIDDLSTGYRENLESIGGDIDFINASLNDDDALRLALEDVELVFHEAAIPSVPRSVEKPRETHDACVNATFSLLLAARDKAVRRLVYAASSSAYGDQPILPKVETMRTYALETVCLRYFNIFGPRQDPSSQYSGVISRFISSLMQGETPVIYGDGEQSRDFNYVANAVDANVKASESSTAVGKIINVANGERTTLNALLALLKGITGKTDVQPEYRETRAGDVRHSLADISSARELLGYEPTILLNEGLQLTLDWWKNSRFAHK